MSRRALILALLVSACAKHGDQPHHSENTLAAGAFVFDAFKLGDSYAKLATRAPWSTPCDVDRKDPQATMAIYTAAGCDHSFPQGTSVVLLTDATPEGAIRAIAWLGGDYFDSRSSFPLHVGVPESEAVQALGTPAVSFEVELGAALRVHQHPHKLYTLIDRGFVVGFVAGDPPPPSDPRWRELAKLYGKNTPLPAAVRAVAAERPACEAAVAHTLELYARDPAFASSLKVLTDRGPGEIETCALRGTKHRVDCLLAAGDTKAMNLCE